MGKPRPLSFFRSNNFLKKLYSVINFYIYLKVKELEVMISTNVLLLS